MHRVRIIICLQRQVPTLSSDPVTFAFVWALLPVIFLWEEKPKSSWCRWLWVAFLRFRDLRAFNESISVGNEPDTLRQQSVGFDFQETWNWTLPLALQVVLLGKLSNLLVQPLSSHRVAAKTQWDSTREKGLARCLAYSEYWSRLPVIPVSLTSVLMDNQEMTVS